MYIYIYVYIFIYMYIYIYTHIYIILTRMHSKKSSIPQQSFSLHPPPKIMNLYDHVQKHSLDIGTLTLYKPIYCTS